MATGVISKLCIGYTSRSRELCDLFTECRRHEVNKKHSPKTEVYNMLLLWGNGLLHRNRTVCCIGNA